MAQSNKLRAPVPGHTYAVFVRGHWFICTICKAKEYGVKADHWDDWVWSEVRTTSLVCDLGFEAHYVNLTMALEHHGVDVDA